MHNTVLIPAEYSEVFRFQVIARSEALFFLFFVILVIFFHIYDINCDIFIVISAFQYSLV
jgi:hypothetical protein